MIPIETLIRIACTDLEPLEVAEESANDNAVLDISHSEVVSSADHIKVGEIVVIRCYGASKVVRRLVDLVKDCSEEK